MDRKLIFLTILLLSAFVPDASSKWIDFKYTTGTYPFNVYPVDLEAGDTLSVTLTWNTTTTGPVFDIFLYKDGSNLISNDDYILKK